MDNATMLHECRAALQAKVYAPWFIALATAMLDAAGGAQRAAITISAIDPPAAAAVEGTIYAMLTPLHAALCGGGE